MPKTNNLLKSLRFDPSIIPNYRYNPISESIDSNKDKLAIVMSHFGTTHDDTKVKTIDAINNKIRRLHPTIDLFEAYTSRIVLKRLSERGIIKHNLTQVLSHLLKLGYTHIVIQPSVILNGSEMHSIFREISLFRSKFKEIRIGTPLLHFPADYNDVIDILTRDNNSDINYIWVGHGTYHPSTSQYAMLSYLLRVRGIKNVFVSTIEGFPSIDSTLIELQENKSRKIELSPFMFVAGEHAKNDIAIDLVDELKQHNYDVSVRLKGLGEYSEIQDIYVRKLEFAFNYSPMDIMRKKKIYETTGEVIK